MRYWIIIFLNSVLNWLDKVSVELQKLIWKLASKKKEAK